MSEKESLFGFTSEEVKLIQETVGKEAVNEAEFHRFLYRSNKLGLNPLLDGSIRLLKRYRKNASGEWVATNVIVTGIDALRAIGDRTGKLTGIARDAIYDEKGRLVRAWAEVYRKDWDRPARETVLYKEFCQTKDGDPIGLWETKPETMLKKCAEAGAHRMAWASDLAGIYIYEEINDDENTKSQPKKTNKTNFEPTQTQKPIEESHATGAANTKEETDKTESRTNKEEISETSNGTLTDKKTTETNLYTNQVVVTEIVEQKTWIEAKSTDLNNDEIILLVPKKLNVDLVPGTIMKVTGKQKGNKVKVSSLEKVELESKEELTLSVTVFSEPKEGVFTFPDGKVKEITFILADDENERHVLSFFNDEEITIMAKELKINDKLILVKYKRDTYKDKPVIIVHEFIKPKEEEKAAS